MKDQIVGGTYTPPGLEGSIGGGGISNCLLSSVRQGRKEVAQDLPLFMLHRANGNKLDERLAQPKRLVSTTTRLWVPSLIEPRGESTSISQV